MEASPVAPGPTVSPNAPWLQVALRTALVAGVFSAVVAGLLVVYSLRSQATEMRDANGLKALRTALSEDPRSEPLKQQIRDRDLVLRRRFARNTQLTATGRWLLLAGLAVFLIALKSAGTLQKKLPRPTGTPPQPGEQSRAARAGRWSLVAMALVLVGSAGALIVTSRTPLEPIGGPTLPPFPSDDEIAKNWPRFRGPGGLAVSAFTNVPTSWNGKTGEGILWKAAVPLPAPSSPVVWGKRVFLIGSSKKKLEAYCYDLDTGKLLWQKPVDNVPGSPAKLPEVMEGVGFAPSTPAADGRRFYAIFANGNLVAFTPDGGRAWARNLGLPDNSYGHASSLALWHDRLLIQYDQAAADDKKSKLIALDTRTGRLAWETRRDSPGTWATPIVVKTPTGEQIIACGDPWLCGYDPATGAELWRAECLGGEIAPSPVYANGVAFTANSGSYASAVRTDGRGNVTKTHILWKAEDGLPDICSPLTNGEFVWPVTSDGLVTCYDAKTGKTIWEHDFKTPCSSSPSLVGDKVYLVTDKGVTFIFAAAREYKEIGKAELGARVRASPAFVDGKIIIRGDKHLFCIGAK